MSRVPLAVAFLFSVAVACAQTFDDLAARAKAAREANNAPQAIELYRQALSANSGWQEGWWFLGTLLYDGDQYAEGADAFRHFTSLNADAAPGWGFLGLCEYETGRYKDALHDVQHALALGAGTDSQLAPVLLYHEALLLTHEGQFDAALQKYSVLMAKVRPGAVSDDMLLSIGLAALRAPEVPNQLNAGARDLHIEAGRTAAFVLAGDFTSADAGFAALLERYPNAPNLHFMHGVYLMARDPETAFAEFRRELQIAPNHHAAESMLAFGLLTRGDSDEALPFARKAAESKDSTPFDAYLYGRALTETGAPENGLHYLEEAEKADTANPDVHVSLGEAYAKLRRPADARRERELALHQLESENRALAQP